MSRISRRWRRCEVTEWTAQADPTTGPLRDAAVHFWNDGRMAPGAATSDLRRHDQVFGELRFDVRFDVLEAVPVAPDWAFVRTGSAGTRLHRCTGRTTAEASQEMVVPHREGDGTWRVARHVLSPINPRAP